MELLRAIEPVEEAIIDPMFVVDDQRAIVHFNRAFYSLLPRGVARSMRGKPADDVISFEIEGQRQCIVSYCWTIGKHIRLDEILGWVARTDTPRTFIISALPILDRTTVHGALVILRNVSDAALVQSKYQDMLDNAKRQREQLKYTIHQRTKDLLEANQRLIRAQQELMAYKRGRML